MRLGVVVLSLSPPPSDALYAEAARLLAASVTLLERLAPEACDDLSYLLVVAAVPVPRVPRVLQVLAAVAVVRTAPTE